MSHARVLCVADEGAKVGTPLIGSRGSSFLIQVDGRTVMFDTGRSGRYLIHNLTHLDVKPDSIDCIVIARASMDCIGGLNTLMTNRKVKVEVHSTPDVWECKRLFGELISPDNVGGIIKVEAGNDWVQLTEHLFITPCVSPGSKELALVLRSNEGAVVFTTCSEDGIAATLAKVKERFGMIRALVGAVNMKKMKQPSVDQIAATIRETYGVKQIHLNGCTAAEGIQKMRVATSNDSIKDFFSGDELDYVV